MAIAEIIKYEGDNSTFIVIICPARSLEKSKCT